MNKNKIIILGFMGCGKTTIGRLYADRYNLNHFDTDKYIEDITSLSISEIFSTRGEKYFRELEYRALKYALNSNYNIISAGGGTVLNENNRKLIRNNNCFLIYLKRDFDKLYPIISNDNKRPLAYHSDSQTLFKLYNKRIHIYESLADYTLDNNSSIQECLDKLNPLIHNLFTNS